MVQIKSLNELIPKLKIASHNLEFGTITRVLNNEE
jgi:hypothetical protein